MAVFSFMQARVLAAALSASLLCGFTPASARGQGGPGQGAQAMPGPPVSAYPARPVSSPQLVADGKSLFSVRCAFCHGSDARGGEGGPNLLHSQIVLNDQNGDSIKPFVRAGRVSQGMPAFDLDDSQLNSLVAFLHSLPVSSHERTNSVLVIPTGDPKAGAAAFQKDCSSCHSPAGDLSGIAGKIPDPKMLQQTWLMPGARGGADVHVKPKTVTVTMKNGQTLQGRLVRMDDFVVTLQTANEITRSLSRHSENDPKIAVLDPLEGHVKLLPTYSDQSIHDITGFLETLQ